MATRDLYRLTHSGAEAPADHWVATRNQDISARYACWYIDHPRIFKWAGLAAFASHRIGILLAAYDLRTEVGDTFHGDDRISTARQRPPGVHDPHEGLRGDVLEQLRRTNNLVYEDIGWAHASYIEKHGVAEIETKLGRDPSHDLMLTGFRKIETGEKLLSSDPTTATDQIWEGNRLLLEHEQRNVIQPQLDLMTPGVMSDVLSHLTWIDFAMESVSSIGDFLDGSAWGAILQAVRNHPAVATAFHTSLETKGRRLLTRSGEPDFSVFDQRWFWIEQEVLPLWRKYESNSGPELLERLKRIEKQPLAAARGIAREK
jgi:hypothetical protein